MTAAQVNTMRRLLELVRRYAEPAASGTGPMHDHVQRVIDDAEAEIKQAQAVPA